MVMTAPDVLSICLALLSCALLLLADRFGRGSRETDSEKNILWICGVAALIGCIARLARLTSMPEGISAEEALIAVQAKALWQTGRFLDAKGLVAQLPQWTGEPAGPLLAVLTAPFVGLLGMTALAVRLPLALLSCLALPAAYLTGAELGGKRAGMWTLMFFSVSPFFVLTARLTAAASLSFCLIPWAFFFALRGLKHSGFLVPAFVLIGCLSYTQNLYFYLSAALVILLAMQALLCGRPFRYVIPAALLGTVLCLPGILTAFANRQGGADLLIGPLLFSHLEEYDKAKNLFTMLKGNLHPDSLVFAKLWAVLTGGFFQNVMHSNMAYSLFATDGKTALGLFSVPLALAGLLAGLTYRLKGKRFSPAVRLLVSFGCATLLAELFFGSVGEMEINGTTSIWDHSQLFPYTVLLAVVALWFAQQRSRWAGRGFLGIFAAGFISLCISLFGGPYAQGANVFFSDYPQAIQAAREVQSVTGAKLYVTSSVYPHSVPDEAARMMLYYTVDADMNTVTQSPDAYGEIYWPEGEDEPEKGCIHVVLQREIRGWMWEDEDFTYETFGRYALLLPR